MIDVCKYTTQLILRNGLDLDLKSFSFHFVAEFGYFPTEEIVKYYFNAYNLYKQSRSYLECLS